MERGAVPRDRAFFFEQSEYEGSLAALGMTLLLRLTQCAEHEKAVILSAVKDL